MHPYLNRCTKHETDLEIKAQMFNDISLLLTGEYKMHTADQVQNTG